MDKCPLSGLPCNHQKCIHATEIGENYIVKKTFDMCTLCGPGFIEANEPKLKQKPDIVPKMSDAPISSAMSDTTLTPNDKLIESLPPLISDVLKLLIHNKIPQARVEIKACPNCGHTLYDITKIGRMGCGNCYEFFKNEMSPIIENYHKSLKHQGKGPKPVPLVEKPSLESLKKELKIAIKQENYEEAAKLRDLIKGLN